MRLLDYFLNRCVCEVPRGLLPRWVRPDRLMGFLVKKSRWFSCPTTGSREKRNNPIDDVVRKVPFGEKHPTDTSLISVTYTLLSLKKTKALVRVDYAEKCILEGSFT